MIIHATCINCKHNQHGSFLYSDYCTIKKKNIFFMNRICRYWQPSLKDMDVWMNRQECEVQE